MPRRKVPLANNELYHICSKSIANFIIFNSREEFERFLRTIKFYNEETPLCKFCEFDNLRNKQTPGIFIQSADNSKKLVTIIAYCVMPTHFHFILERLKDGGITKFVNAVLKSYSRYFNLKHNRKGPLWQNRFSNVLIENDEQFMHIHRYIHINPVKAHLVDDPKDWPYSSYKEYAGLSGENDRFCDFSNYFNMDAVSYTKFVKDEIDYQRNLLLSGSVTLPERRR